MFEGKQLTACVSHASGHAGFGEDVLVPLTWSGLVARLGAMRDLRAEFAAEFAKVAVAQVPSFDSVAAAHLRDLRKAGAEFSGKHAVNLVASGNGKSPGAKQVDRASSATSAFRGNA